jgi:hypothetical protein
MESSFPSLIDNTFFFTSFLIVFLDDFDITDFLELTFLEDLRKGEGEERSLITLGYMEALY